MFSKKRSISLYNPFRIKEHKGRIIIGASKSAQICINSWSSPHFNVLWVYERGTRIADGAALSIWHQHDKLLALNSIMPRGAGTGGDVGQHAAVILSHHSC
eukprot:scaffold66793_cov20-Prasinocladus_malaysianus.AAC.2